MMVCFLIYASMCVCVCVCVCVREREREREREKERKRQGQRQRDWIKSSFYSGLYLKNLILSWSYKSTDVLHPSNPGTDFDKKHEKSKFKTTQKSLWLYNKGPQKFIYKKMCIYSYMFKLQSPSKWSPFYAIHLSRLFLPTAQNDFWTHQFWCLLMLLLFMFHLYHIGKKFPFKQDFSSGETKESHSGQDQVNRECMAWGSHRFWSKTAEHSAWCGQVCS